MNNLPICIVVYLTNYCELECNHCFFVQQKCLNTKTICFSKIKEILQIFKDNNVYMVAYTGGDPLLHPDIFKILNLTSKLNMLPLLGISGIDVELKTAQKIYDSGVRCVQIGLNGSNKNINDKYRGKGSFDKIKKSILLLQDCGLNVNLAFCLDKNNYKDLNNMLELSNVINAYKVKIEFWKSTSGHNDKELCKKDMINIYDNCEKYMAKNKKNNWIQCPNYKSELSKIHNSAIVIMPNGEIKNNELSRSLGNIHKDKLIDVINHKGDINER